MCTIPQHQPHPLKTEIKRVGVTYWQLRILLGGSPSEGKLSRYLNGIEIMPPKLEKRLRQVVTEAFE